MKIERKQWGNVTVLTFDGELDVYNLPSVASRVDRLIEDGNVRLVFDIGSMPFVSSSAVGYLVRTRKAVLSNGGDVVLVRPSKIVAKVLDVLGLGDFFRVAPSTEEALRIYLRDTDLTALSEEHRGVLGGESAISFTPLDEDGADLLGPGGYHGRISSAYSDGLSFRYRIPEKGASPLDDGNFDEVIAPGRIIRVRFRQPLATRPRYLEAICAVKSIDREIYRDNDAGANDARVTIQYREINPTDRAALDDFVSELEDLRSELEDTGEHPVVNDE
jgi:anti-anti-sigma factor